MIAACSREETPAPPPAAPATSTAAAPAPAAAPPPVPMPARTASYEDAIDWFRSTPGFRFTITEGGVRAEGELTRKTVGSEVVTMTANGEQWRAEAGPRGIAWSRGGAEA
ncbi:MAG TPA: hypothetical protein VHK90_15590, partial [Thermoanaerobaculia bacterium]|nr:hypothetical protein [Thermoanaerobaculia bacterium]